MAEEHADFWREWWERDYSWEGLGAYLPNGQPKHPWEGWIVLAEGELAEHPEPQRFATWKTEKVELPDGARLATLQDYWRDQENDLIADRTSPKDEDGNYTRHFTRFHLPLHWPDGTPTGKAEWNEAKQSKLTVLIGEKIEKSAETEFGFFNNVKGPDRRVQFQGGVFLNFNVNDFRNPPAEPDADPEPIQLNWRSDFAFFSGDAGFNSATFSRDAVFDHATFSGYARFESATFSGDARFESATFSGYAWFLSATFSGDAWFLSATFSRNAVFDSATFSGYARFESATFSGDARFISATFSGFAWFISTAFSGNAWFISATFSGNAKFDSAIFVGNVSFQGDGASFSVEPFQLLPKVRSDEERAISGDVAFADKFERVIENASIATRAFKYASFEDCVFLGDVNFNNRDFTEATSFKRARFFRLASFHGSRLHQGVSFFNAEWDRALHRDRQCEKSPVDNKTWFETLGFGEWPAPDKTTLERLHVAEQKRRVAQGKLSLSFEVWLRDVFETKRTKDVAAFRKLDKLRTKELEEKEVKTGKKIDTQEEYFAALEDCFRTLKLAMEDKRDRTNEGAFFQLEIKARRRRRKPGVPFWERIMSDLYGMTSQYGNSVVRPIWWIFGNVFLFGLIYLALGSWQWDSWFFWKWNFGVWKWNPFEWNWDEFWGAMNYSAGRVFGFGPWAEKPEAGSMMGNLLNTDGDGWGPRTAFGVRFLASLQTLMAIILVFLSGLAVRRRFQIN